jgi:hypothetical protein
VGESGKGNSKVKVGDNVLPVNLLPYLAEAYMSCVLMRFKNIFRLMPSSASPTRERTHT